MIGGHFSHAIGYLFNRIYYYGGEYAASYLFYSLVLLAWLMTPSDDQTHEQLSDVIEMQTWSRNTTDDLSFSPSYQYTSLISDYERVLPAAACGTTTCLFSGGCS